jgi:AraC-like DNA-binding protein
MLTARSAIDDRLRALRIGVDDYLTKPFVNEELLVRIENLLHNASIRQSAEIEMAEVLPKIGETEQKWLDALEANILQNIDNIQFNIDDLADAMHMSTRQFYRQIKQYIGETPSQYLKTYRLKYARQLLESKKMDSVKAVAYAVGFPNATYFSREFKKAFGNLPSDYLQ